MAELPLAFHPDARIEALDAYDWYAERSLNAANAFQEELQKAGIAVQRSPALWARYLFGTRRYLLKRFPFVLVYRVAANRIEVLAVAHGRRQPGYWKNRLKSE
jgi:toxin ParE1/3/4